MHVEHRIMSATSDIRQRRQKVAASKLQPEANGAGDGSRLGDADNDGWSSQAVSATRVSWFHRMRVCVVVVMMLVCGWVFASYVKQLHETHLWFSNIQVRCLDSTMNQMLMLI